MQLSHMDGPVRLVRLNHLVFLNRLVCLNR